MTDTESATPSPSFGSLEDCFGADSSSQADGKWVDFGAGKILIAFAGEDNPRYEKSLSKYTQDFRMQMTSDHMRMSEHMEPQLKKAMRQTYAEAVVLDWKDVRDAQGQLIPFSAKAVYEAFERLPAFFRWVREYAGSLENYSNQSEDFDSKNS